MDGKILKMTQQPHHGIVEYISLDGTHSISTMFPNECVYHIYQVDMNRVLVYTENYTRPAGSVIYTRPTVCSIHEIDIRTGNILRSVPAPDILQHMCWDGQYVWGTTESSKHVLKIDLNTGCYTEINIGAWVCNIYFDGVHVVVEIVNNVTFVIIDPHTNKLLRKVFVRGCEDSMEMAASDKYIFLSDQENINVVSLEVGEVVKQISTTRPVTHLIYDGKYVWGIHACSILQIDVESLTLVGVIPVPNSQTAIMASTQYVHVVQHKVKYIICNHRSVNVLQLLVTHDNAYYLYECASPRPLQPAFTRLVKIDPMKKSIILSTDTHDKSTTVWYYTCTPLTAGEVTQWLLTSEV